MSKLPPWGLFPAPIMPLSGAVGAGVAAGAIVGRLRCSRPGMTFSIVSGNYSVDAENNLVTTAQAGAAGTTDTVRVRASRASPYLQIDQDIVISALTVLGDVTLSASSYPDTAAPGTIIGAIQNITPDATIDVYPPDDRVAIDGSNNLIVGSVAAADGSFNVSIRQTLDGALNSPHLTLLTLTVTGSGSAAGSLDFTTPEGTGLGLLLF